MQYIGKVHSYTQLFQALCEVSVARQHHFLGVSTPPPSPTFSGSQGRGSLFFKFQCSALA